MTLPSLSRKNPAASDRQHFHRPFLEPLEDRCLPSGGYAQVNLASDVPGLARVADTNLVNPWGIAFSPTGPFWFADNGSGASDLLDGRGQPFPLVVAVPPVTGSGGTPTGTVFNGGAGFAISENGVTAPSRFLFATEDGAIAGWTTVVDPTRALVAVDPPFSGAVFKGLALATDPAGQSFLYAADFSRGTIDVFDQAFRPVVRTGSFQDPDLPAGFAPFNIQNINDLLFVTYARQDAAKHDDVAGAGNGFIDVYDPDGRLVRRFASRGALDSPWGLALAPADFGPFGGALLAGNNGDGHINAYDLGSGASLGVLADDKGLPIAIPGLWALTFGNGHAAGDADTLFFAAGVGDEGHGLFGAIQASSKRGADTAGAGVFDPNNPDEPGDYPLPPRGGPALRAGSEENSVPISDLLPLRDSSLALVPTLVILSQPIVRPEATVPVASLAGNSSNGAAATASSILLLTPADGVSQPARGARHNALALTSFLDWNSSPDGPKKTAGAQPPNTQPDAVGARNSTWIDPDAVAGGLLAGFDIETIGSRSNQEQVPASPLPSCPANEVLAGVPVESRPQSADDRTLGGECTGTQGGGKWTNLANYLLAFSISMIWASRLKHATRPRHESY
jgi:uncharacterized protein (TIGR03118 family)